MVTQLALTLEHDDWANSGQATFSFSLDPQLMYFQGHFPQYHILPAVAQLKLLMDALHQLEPKLQFKGAPAIKFTSILRPNDQVRLELNLNRATLKLRFTFYRVGPEEQVTSSGTIALAYKPAATEPQSVAQPSLEVAP